MKNLKRWYVSPCGLNCAQCPIHLRTEEELNYWREQNVDPDKVRCDGCRSNRKGDHWAPECNILDCCVYTKRLEFCAECPELPCSMLEEWAAPYEHHRQALQTLLEIKRSGIENWLTQNNPVD